MLVLKNKDTNLLDSEKKTLHSFLFLYGIFSIVIIVFSGIIYFKTQKELVFEKQNSRLKTYSSELIKDLKYLHDNYIDGSIYPRYSSFNSAIYDSEGELIFSTLNNKNVNLNKTIYEIENKIHYIRLLNSYYLGAMYVVIEIDGDSAWKNIFQNKVLFFGLILFSILIFGGYFLLKLLLKPMRESLHLLNRFIKDTTHELNTPITSILANIEMIDQSIMHSKNLKKLKRIDIASKTISNLYNDLTFVALGNRFLTKNENIDIENLLKSRCDFFQALSSIKKITFEFDLHTSKLFIDENKISRVIDNLLSNAIKYNKIGGKISVSTTEKSFTIEDSGIGIKSENLDKIFHRYSRFNDSEGGFGIGLSIVYAVVNEYNMQIDIDSTINIGTKVTISW